MELLIILLILGAPVLFGIVLYNRLVALRQTRKNAFSDIDVQLKQRHDLIPNLVNTVKGYASHESELLQRVTDARANAMRQSSVDDKVAAEGTLGAAMMQLLAVAENYPDLKGNLYCANFIEGYSFKDKLKVAESETSQSPVTVLVII